WWLRWAGIGGGRVRTGAHPTVRSVGGHHASQGGHVVKGYRVRAGLPVRSQLAGAYPAADSLLGESAHAGGLSGGHLGGHHAGQRTVPPLTGASVRPDRSGQKCLLPHTSAHRSKTVISVTAMRIPTG